MPDRNFVFRERDYIQLRDDLFHLKRENAALKNRLTAYGMRRHQGVYMPARSPTIYTATASTVSVTASTELQHDFTSITTGADFSLASGIVTAEVDAVCDFWLNLAAISVPFTQNDHTDLYFTLQTRTTSAAAWGTSMITLRKQTSWPNVAVLSGDGANNEYGDYGSASRSFSAGRQFRLVSQLQSGTLPAGTDASTGTLVIVKR